MSPRAAWRLERLGFEVYDYAAGKVDWLASGLPTVTAGPRPRRALDAADRDPAICSPATPVADLGARPVLVVNEQHILLGRVPAGDRGDGTAIAEQLMEPGPTTVRAHEPLEELLDRMEKRNVKEVAVTTPQGHLLGVVRRS